MKNILIAALAASHSYVAQTLLWKRKEAQTLLDTQLLPKSEYDKRSGLGHDAQGLDDSSPLTDGVIRADDPRLQFTYGEFPLASLDVLLDRAMKIRNNEVASVVRSSSNPTERITVVDVGSGCGRLCLYMALTRLTWAVHGIEISDLLHEEATQAAKRAEQYGFLRQRTDDDLLSSLAAAAAVDDDDPQPRFGGHLSLHLGPAEKFGRLLSQADILFCYSTAWEASGFSEQAGTLILSPQWNQVLTANTIQRSPLVITTDRALDPAYGWKILEEIDVANPEVFGSRCYIQQRLF